MSEPLVSILIPCYNAERFIAETLESALAQTWPRVEIIVVNNGSTDGSGEVLRRYESRGVKAINTKNEGASVARNHAYGESHGEFIQYLDADDLLAPNKIELQMRRLLSAEGEMLSACAWGRFYDSPEDAVFVREPVWADMQAVDWLVTAWTGGFMMASHAWLTPRSVIERVGGWDETRSPNDDGEFFTRALLASRGVLFCEEARVFYRSGVTGSYSKARSEKMLAGAYHVIEQSTGCLLKHEDSPRTHKACAAYFQRFIYDTYPDSPELVRKAEAHVRSFGGAQATYGGSAKMRLLTGLVGWKAAKLIHRFSSGFRPRFGASKRPTAGTP